MGHLYRERLEILVKDEILSNLNFINFGMCMDCIKKKQTKHTKKGVTRSAKLFKIIHRTFVDLLIIHLWVEKSFFYHIYRRFFTLQSYLSIT